MKNILTLLACVFCLSVFWSCGDTEDSDTIISIGEPKSSWDNTWDNLSDEYVLELMKLELPVDWVLTENPNLLAKYRHAQLLQQFGDIPQVRTVIEFELNTADGYVSNDLHKHIAYLEAHLFLWPSETTRRTLEETRKEQEILGKENIKIDNLIGGDPKLYIRNARQRLLIQFGDIPAVDTYTSVLLKRLLNETVTNEEHLAFLEAKFHLWPNERNQKDVENFRKWLARVE